AVDAAVNAQGAGGPLPQVVGGDERDSEPGDRRVEILLIAVAMDDIDSLAADELPQAPGKAPVQLAVTAQSPRSYAVGDGRCDELRRLGTALVRRDDQRLVAKPRTPAA